MASKGSFEVKELDKGFEIVVYTEPSGQLYVEPLRGVASTKAEVSGFFQRWLEGPKPFKFEDGK